MSTSRDARFWDRFAKKYAKSKIADEGGYERTIKRTRALLKPEARVLELGCGTGSTALRLAERVQSYLATDISTKMIEIAEAKRMAKPIPSLRFETATAESLSAKNETFDVILAFNYLHLVRDPQDVLHRIHGMLGKGDLFISKTPCLGDMNVMIRSVLLPIISAVRLGPHVAVFDTEDLARMVKAAGFKIVATEAHSTKGKDTRPFILARRK